MRFRTLEIRWHDSKPISTCDFQPVQFKKARPSAGKEENFAAQSYRLATGGEDNHVRVWMVHPNIVPTTMEAAQPDAGSGSRPPRVEYLATLSRHSAAVNVVRFSPNGELIASAGDDGMIIIWAPSASPQASTYGSDLTPEELQLEKEFWKPRTAFRCTTMQVYDLAWSPSGEYILAGSTDNAARVFASSDGKCVHEIAEHNHYVQGVAWDPMNEYIATQSSDRSMHIYNISHKNGVFEAHAVGKNTRLPHYHRHSRTPSAHGKSTSRPRTFRSQSITSDAESAAEEPQSASVASASQSTKDSHSNRDTAPLTPASTPSAASMFPPPPVVDKPSSRRSSFSGSNAPSSPSTFTRYGRSPSPMPALPAIRTLPPSSATWSLSNTSTKLYGDESFTNFFRRLTFSPDGGLLMTPAGQFEDPSIVIPTKPSKDEHATESSTPARGRKGRPSTSITTDFPQSSAHQSTTPSTSSSVYIYSRANFARPPIGQLPGHKKASVAVRFSPILYDLRKGVVTGLESTAPSDHHEVKSANLLEKGKEGVIDVDLLDPTPDGGAVTANTTLSPQRPQQSPSTSLSHIAAPAPVHANMMPSPALSAVDSRQPPTPAASKPSTPTPYGSGMTSSASGGLSGSMFLLPYRMLYAVVTMDTVAIYDTQQAGPVCMLTKLHYDEFTDLTWSPDGQCLIVSSRDGYCTLIIFDEILPAHHIQQPTLQLQSIAHHHYVPLSYPNTPAVSTASLPVIPQKRSGDPPLTPATSVDGSESAFTSYMFPTVPAPAASTSSSEKPSTSVDATDAKEPPKKKRRVALTRVSDLD